MFGWSLRNQFLIPTLGLIIAGMALATVLSYRSSKAAIEAAMIGQIEQLATALGKQTQAWVEDAQTDLTALAAAGQEAFLASLDGDAAAVAEANRRLKEFADKYGDYEIVGVAGANGATVAASDAGRVGVLNVADRDYFHESLQGRETVSDILPSRLNGNPIFALSRPIVRNGQIAGVLFAALDLTRYAGRFVDTVKVGAHGYAYLMAKSGLLAAHPVKANLLKTNLLEFDWGRTMATSKNGLLTYTFTGEEKIVAYRTVAATGWLIGVGASTADIFAPVVEVRNESLLVALLILLVVAGCIQLIVSPIARALKTGVAFAETVRLGNLSRRLSLRRGDEIGQLASALDAMADGLDGRAKLAEAIADGDLSHRVELASQEDVLGDALQRMVQNLSALIHQIQTAGEQIACGSGQVAESAENLSQGATESASSLEEISASMMQLANQTRQNAGHASRANQLAENARGAAVAGNSAMAEMVAAMDEIDRASENISKIIKTIDEIAFQTNLLALNAAVEAARAGQHGKGFAVVAEEVRNLAARSARAARETAELIQGSVEKTKKGAQIADRTAKALGEIVTEITEASTLVAEITAASNDQAEGIAQVNQGLSQIDAVIQQNTASAEESAASAEELAGQAQQLQEMLSRFRLSATGSAPARAARPALHAVQAPAAAVRRLPQPA